MTGTVRSISTVILAVVSIGMFGSPAEAGIRKPEPEPAFKIGSAYGPRFDGFGVDIKRFFVHGRSSLTPLVAHPAVDYVRVPFNAMTFTDDHHFDGRPYRRLIETMRELRERQPSIRFYLNRKNFTRCGPKGTKNLRCLDFPEWMKINGRLVPARYGRYMAEVLQHFRGEGIPIHLFGPENEHFNNEGDLTPLRFNRAVRAMRIACDCRMPKIVGNDSATMRYAWMKPAHIDIASLHSHVRKFSWQEKSILQITRDARRARVRLWNTEFHWDHWSDSFRQRSLNSLPQLLFQACHGVRMISLWNMYDMPFKAKVMSATANSRCRRATSLMPGVDVYANDRRYVWVVNPTRRTYRNRRVDHNGFRYTRWRSAQPISGWRWRALSFPARSITLIRR